ncbi:TPA: phage tail protein [Salmonella enterica subsp. enterica serovar Newport]
MATGKPQFNWKIRPDMTVESEPKVTSIKLGDGYEQRRPAGLNNHLAKYNVTVRIRKGEHQNLEAFLSRHGGVKSFLWTPPYTWTQIRVICRKWSISVGSLWVTVTTTFEQVVI